jgi:ribonuclease HI
MPDIIDERAINIFTDGSSYSGPRRGGVGMDYITVDNNGSEVRHDYCPPGYKSATNNQMELQACIEAVEYLGTRHCPIDVSRFSRVVIYTDSLYVVDNVTNAKFVWPKTKWALRGGAPVANTEQWKLLMKRTTQLGKRVDFCWVKGHKSSTGNKGADKLAKQSAKGYLRPALTNISVRKKKSARSVERGSVKLSGQRLTIRIITTEWLRPHHSWKYKYEVMSPKSEFFQNVDIAFSDVGLRDGHTYFVVMGDDTQNPRIAKLIREIEPKK